jgi:transcription-repair coupling factor (superfamily II helicase)
MARDTKASDHFGLAQLYQLRGRVGRSDKRAYCYCLIPAEGKITEDAKQRLQVIQRHSDLGAGFSVASHDLEIRGSGDLLGKDQSGHVAAIGIDLYFELLEETLQSLKGQPKKNDIEPEINLPIPAFFPNDYLPDVGERVQVYRKLSACDSESLLESVEIEIRDRFGALPEEVLNLLGLMRVKLFLRKLHVIRMSTGPKKTSLQFADTTPVSPEVIVKLMKTHPTKYSVTPDHKLVFANESKDWRVLLNEVAKLTELLGIS